MSVENHADEHRARRGLKTATFVAAGAIAATVIAPELPVSSGMHAAQRVERALRLTAGDSVLNIPLNLLQDIANIPDNELNGINTLGDSLIYSGSWVSPSATNIWGEDPGDPGHFLGVIDTLIPIPQISGADDPEPGYGSFSWSDAAAGHLGLGQQLTLLADAELPVTAASDADYSAPATPATEITGLAPLDSAIWMLAIGLGLQSFPMTAGYFQVPLSDLESGYTFPTVVDPSMGVGPNGSVPSDSVLGFEGTHPATPADVALLPQDSVTATEGITTNAAGEVVNGNGNPVNLLPWSNETFKLDLTYPFQHFFNTLEQPVDLSNYTDGFDLPTLTQAADSLQSLLAGMIIAFDPFTPGATACGDCTTGPAQYLTPIALVNDLNKLIPGNPSLQDWLGLVGTTNANAPYGTDAPYGEANGPTEHQADFLQTYDEGLRDLFDIGNPGTTEPPSGVDTPISFPTSSTMQNLITFMQDIGVQKVVGELATALGYQSAGYDELVGSSAGSAGAESTVSLGQMLTDLTAGF